MALKPVIIGLTGGIGSGKTYVARIFRGLGARIIDADKIAHEVIDWPVIRRALVKWYGRSILDKSGVIKRRQVARIVFASPDEVRRLNRLTHPYIRKEILKRADHRLGRVIVIDAPLLLESRLDKFCDYVIFIRTPAELRWKRIRASRDWEPAELKKRARHQMSLAEKKARADFIIDNKSPAAALAHAKSVLKMITTRKY